MIPVAPSPHPHQWTSNEMLNNKMNNNTTGGGCKSTTPSNFNSSQKNMFGCCHQGTKNSTTSCNNSSRSSNSPENRNIDNCSNKNLVNLLASSNNKSNRVNLSYRISAPVHYFAHTSSQRQIDMYMDLSDCGERRCKNQNHQMHHHHHRCMHQNQHHHHHHHFNNQHHHHHHQAYFNNNANPMQQPNIIQCGGNANMMDLDSDGDASSDCSYSATSTSTSGGTTKKSRAMVFKRYLKLFQKNPTCGGTLTGSKKDWNKYLYYNQIMEYFNK